MNDLAKTSRQSSHNATISIESEISLFLNTIKMHRNFQQFWCAHRNSFPRIASLVYRFSIVPATNVPSESAFSIAGHISRKERSSLSARALRHLLVLKYRKNLVSFFHQEENH